MSFLFTSTRQLRTAFRREFKGKLDFRLIPDYSGDGKMYKADVRVSFVDWIDYLRNENLISDRLARSATIEPN